MICKNCEKSFPSSITIEGKRKVLSNRKYCLECSPWGKHNTVAFGHINITSISRSCEICNKAYTGKGLVCASCSVNSRRFAVKQKSIEYLGGKCSHCGYDKCPAAMVFHHLDPSKKDFAIGGHHNLGFETIKKELDKCILLCQNCHHELHYQEHSEKRKLVIKRYENHRKQMVHIVGVEPTAPVL